MSETEIQTPEAPEAPVSPDIRVVVTANREIRITPPETRLPRMTQIKAKLPSALRRYLYSSSLEYNVQNTHETITAQQWADAIGAALLDTQPHEGIRELHLDPIYMVAGDTMYRMQPVAAVGQTRALTLARRKALDSARVEAELILSSARQTANSLTQAAAQMQAEARAVLASANGGRPQPPEWAIAGGLSLKYCPYAHDWLVLTSAPIQLKWLEGWGREYVIPDPAPARVVALWIPVPFRASAVRVDRAEDILPHIGEGGACMGLDPAPVIDSTQSLDEAGARIAQLCQTANLESLYVPQQEDWDWLLPADLRAEHLYHDWMMTHTTDPDEGRASTWTA